MKNEPGHSSFPASIELPASMENWDQLMAFARMHAEEGLSDSSRVYKLMLAIEELLSNVMRSASESRDQSSSKESSICPVIRIACHHSSSAPSETHGPLTFEIQDTCPPYDPHFEAIPVSMEDTPIESRQIGGLGLFLVKSSVDRVDYEYKDGRNQYTLSMDCSA